MVIRAWQKDVSLAALQHGPRPADGRHRIAPYDVDAAVAKLRDLVDDHMLGPSTRCIVEAGADKSAASPHPPAAPRATWQLGYGARQRCI